MRKARCGAAILTLMLTLTTALTPGPALAATAAEIDREARKGLQDLYAKNPKAKELGAKAKGILVFPGIYKAGFMFGAQYGEGALLKKGKTAGYYNTVGASYGFQAGAQKYGYALFFMTDARSSTWTRARASSWAARRASSSSTRARPGASPRRPRRATCTRCSSTRRA